MHPHPSVPLKVPVIHTGFVVPRTTQVAEAENCRKRIVVSAGGGFAGEPLLRTAIEALRYFEDDPQIEMKMIAGPFVPDEDWSTLRTLARGKPQLSLVRCVNNLCDELRGAAASISQAGYNTCLNVVRAGVPALLVPFARGTDTEQQNRALRLQRLGAADVFDEQNLNPGRLAAAIMAVMNRKMTKPQFDLDGAKRSTQIIASMVTATPQAKAIAYHSGYEN